MDPSQVGKEAANAELGNVRPYKVPKNATSYNLLSWHSTSDLFAFSAQR